MLSANVDDDDDDDLTLPSPKGDVTHNQRSFLNDWEKKVQYFFDLFNRLKARADFVKTQPNSIQREYAQVMAKGMGIKSKIAFVQNSINNATGAYASVKDWFKTKFGLNEIDAKLRTQQRLGELGIAFLIPVAIITSGIAVITVWIKNAEMLDLRLKSQEKLIEMGVKPDKAKQMTDTKHPPTNGIFSMFGFNLKPLLPAAVAIGIFILLRSRN